MLASNSLWKTEMLSLWFMDSAIVEDFEVDRTLQGSVFLSANLRKANLCHAGIFWMLCD